MLKKNLSQSRSAIVVYCSNNSLEDVWHPSTSTTSSITSETVVQCHLLPARPISSATATRNVANRSWMLRFSRLRAFSSDDSADCSRWISLSWSMRRIANRRVDAAKAMLPNPCRCFFNLCQNVILLPSVMPVLFMTIQPTQRKALRNSYPWPPWRIRSNTKVSKPSRPTYKRQKERREEGGREGADFRSLSK